VFDRSPYRHGVCRFLHTTTAGNDCDHDGTGSNETVTHSIADPAQGRKENSAEDRGGN